MKNAEGQELAFVSVGMINVDHSYQRKLEEARVKRISGARNAGAVKAVSLSRRADGTLWVYDGQHTVAEARLAGREFVPAVIIDGDPRREAEWFLLVNGGSKRVSQRDIQHAGVVAGDKISELVRDMLEAHGVRVKAGGVAGKGETNAVGLLRKLAKSHPVRLELAFDLIDAAWADEPLAWTGRIISGVFDLTAQPDGVDVAHAMKRKKITPQRIEDAISAAQAVHGVAGNAAWGISAQVMRKLANM